MSVDAGAAATPEWLPADAPPTECSGREQPGTSALRAVLLDHFGGTNLGIYACREVRGGGSLSVHADGRAFDHGMPGRMGGPAREAGNRVLELVARNARGLGVQRVIWWHRLYDAGSPFGRAYYGDDAHETHLHIEQTVAASRTLTEAAIRLALYGPPAVTGDEMIMLRRAASDADTMRWLYLDGRRFRLQGWTSGVQPLIDAGVPTVALSDTQLRTIPEV